MFNTRVFTLSVLTDRYNIYIVIKSLIPFQRSTRSHVCIEIEFSAKEINMIYVNYSLDILFHITDSRCIMVNTCKSK
jgi:hypothetical protein